jgi:hypothetical protein
MEHVTHSAQTDFGGNFQIGGVPAGRYAISVRYPGYSLADELDVVVPEDVEHELSSILIARTLKWASWRCSHDLNEWLKLNASSSEKSCSP